MQITEEFIQPLPSSTVLVLREERGFPEVLMVLRKKNTSFGASYVFPGGLVEKSDTTEEEELNPKEKELFNKRMDVNEGGFAYYSAAIRELFEEAGVLGTATDYDENILPKGTVVRVEIDEEPQPNGWESEDEKISEVGWCVDIPAELYWGENEVQRLLDHDWRTSRSLAS